MSKNIDVSVVKPAVKSLVWKNWHPSSSMLQYYSFDAHDSSGNHVDVRSVCVFIMCKPACFGVNSFRNSASFSYDSLDAGVGDIVRLRCR